MTSIFSMKTSFSSFILYYCSETFWFPSLYSKL